MDPPNANPETPHPILEPECVLVDDIKVEEPCIQYDESSGTNHGNSEKFEPPQNFFLPSVMVEKRMYICVMCKNPYEKKSDVKVRDEADNYKCNKCILHSKLKTVFDLNRSSKTLKCDECAFITNFEQTMKRHVAGHHLDEDITENRTILATAKKTVRGIKSKAVIEPDIITIEDDESNEIPAITSRGGNNQRELLRSVLIKKRLFICQTCMATFERPENIKFHDHFDRYRCNKCILHSRLRMAFINRQLGKVLKCSKCNFNTRWERRLKKHAEWHCKADVENLATPPSVTSDVTAAALKNDRSLDLVVGTENDDDVATSPVCVDDCGVNPKKRRLKVDLSL